MSSETDNNSADATTRQGFSTKAQACEAVVDIAACAKRTLDIFSPKLEPVLYQSAEFLAQLKRLALGRGQSHVRVLLQDPALAVRRGHKLVEMSRHLPSFIEIRTACSDYESHTEDFMVADGRAYVCRARSTQWRGAADTDNAGLSRRYLNLFVEIWERSEIEQEFRRLHL